MVSYGETGYYREPCVAASHNQEHTLLDALHPHFILIRMAHFILGPQNRQVMERVQHPQGVVIHSEPWARI